MKVSPQKFSFEHEAVSSQAVPDFNRFTVVPTTETRSSDQVVHPDISEHYVVIESVPTIPLTFRHWGINE